MVKIVLSIISLCVYFSCLTENRKVKTETSVSQKKKISVAMVPNERLFKMDIAPDTFYLSVSSITSRIFNHSEDTASFGLRFSLDYFNQPTLSWENVLPQNFVSTLERRQIMPHSYSDFEFSLFDNQMPGKYRITLDLHTKKQSNIIIGEFFLTDDKKYDKRN